MELGSCYLPQYAQASFNGIPFDAMEVGSEHGRRGAEGEFPFGENTAYADLGRKIRRYTLSGRFATNDHLERASALIAACELPGPGVLVHPTRGVLQAACVSLSVRDNILEEQGITYVDMEFVEGASWSNGLVLAGTVLGLELSTVLGASSDSFLTTYSPHTEPVWRQPSLVILGRQAVGMIAQQYRRAIGNTRQLSTLRAAADLDNVAADSELVLDATIVNDALRLGSNAIARIASPETRFEEFREIANWAAAQPAQATKSGEALVTHTRVVAGVYMAQASTATTFQQMQQVFTRLDLVGTVLDQEIALAYQRCDNNLYLSLKKFREEYSANMYRKAYGTPTLIEYDFGGPVSPLVAAYAIWGDAKKHRTIEQSNYMGALGMAGPVVVGAN